MTVTPTILLPMPEQVRVLAHHEAGHATAAYMAGPAAEARYRCVPALELPESKLPDGDFEVCRGCFPGLSRRDSTAKMLWAMQVGSNLMATPAIWRVVTTLAPVIEEREEVGGAEAVAIMHEAWLTWHRFHG